MWRCSCGGDNPDSATSCQSCGARIPSSISTSIKDKEQREKEIQQEQKLIEQRQLNEKISSLKSQGKDGYWEYRVVSLTDDRTGAIQVEKLSATLNELGLQGWHLKCAYTNDLGVNSRSYGVGGMSSGTNATIGQNILIFERYINF